MVAVVYLVADAVFGVGATGTCIRPVESGQRWSAVLRDPTLGSFAPLMLCVSAIVGLWLGPTLPFLLTHASRSQYMAGLYAHQPSAVGWLLLGYSLVFAPASSLVPRFASAFGHRAMRVSLLAMLGVCAGLGLLNASSSYSTAARWMIGTGTAALIMVEAVSRGGARVAHRFTRPAHRSRRRHGRLLGAAGARRCGGLAARGHLGAAIRGGRTDRCNARMAILACCCFVV